MKQRGLLRASSPAWKQIQLNPTAREPYAIALPEFKALQAHLGLSRHANPALISSQHFPLLLSRPAFLLPPSPRPGALSHAWGSWTVPRAELSQATQPSSSPAALDKACGKKGGATLQILGLETELSQGSPRSTNTAGSKSLCHQSTDLKRKLRSPFSRPGCSPTQLASLSPVLIRAPKLTDSEPKPILFQSDFVRALFAFKNLSPALSSYRWEKTTGVEVNPKGSPGRMAALGSCLYWLSVGCLSGSLYLPRTAGLGCFT